ncbi:hypothetical protein [Nitrosovibrio sp. Nv6]|uniref:hypothetical protein n=1 Tax=Nitrosovibrio sp. Nv6 TaxID=1855340 RepID=UPI0008C457F5|nr:hypothetical protein [Nitrosovibrio sp. Nv6]SEO64152.1 hypothetical protein SAMN05216316_0687 [Nitrosovibrio sp. Nv6]
MKWAGMIADPCTGNVSHTKLWANVAYASATGAFWWSAVQGQLTPDIWLIYLGVVGAHTAASKLIGLRYSSPPPQPQPMPMPMPPMPMPPPSQGDMGGIS